MKTEMKQPPDSKLCGQYCIAYLLGKNPQEICEQMGEEKLTLYEVMEFLKKKDILISKNPYIIGSILKDPSLIILEKEGELHCVVYKNKIVYDPNGFESEYIDAGNFWKMEGFDILCAIEILGTPVGLINCET